jgi:hypothetical protein
MACRDEAAVAEAPADVDNCPIVSTCKQVSADFKSGQAKLPYMPAIHASSLRQHGCRWRLHKVLSYPQHDEVPSGHCSSRQGCHCCCRLPVCAATCAVRQYTHWQLWQCRGWPGRSGRCTAGRDQPFDQHLPVSHLRPQTAALELTRCNVPEVAQVRGSRIADTLLAHPQPCQTKVPLSRRSHSTERVATRVVACSICSS